MAAASWPKYLYRAYLSQPKAERALYRIVKRRKVCRIVEVGIGDVGRARRLIEVAQRYARAGTVHYSGLDWFEMRVSCFAPLKLKETHCELRKTAAQIRLLPGEPGQSLGMFANDLVGSDLVIISSAVDWESLTPTLRFVQRMLHERTAVLRESVDSEGQPSFETISHEEIAAWADSASGLQAA